MGRRDSAIDSKPKNNKNCEVNLFLLSLYPYISIGMKVGIFTPRSTNPLHPRLILFKSFFEKENIDYQIHSFTEQTSKEFSFQNWMSLWFFDWNAVARCKPLLSKYDVILVNDMKYLPLVRNAHRAGKKVVYETLDHNVYLRFYQLETRFPIFKILKPIITSYFKKQEKKFVTRYCNEVLVNSDALYQYLGKGATKLYYSSPFEAIDTRNNPAHSPALLYLGAFTTDKGALQIISLARKLNVPLFIFGPVNEPMVTKAIQIPNVQYTNKVSTQELNHLLKNLLTNHFLLGVSLIEPVHYSYEIQEANKDIDYLALGIPIIGNSRKPTADKIEKGCGWFYDDDSLHEKILNRELLELTTENCLRLYNSQYASKQFYTNLKACWSRLSN